MTCSVAACGNRAKARGWCKKHYARAWEHHRDFGQWLIPSKVNPLVCVCAVPDADPLRDYGMCRNADCKRKPLALMKAAS